MLYANGAFDKHKNTNLSYRMDKTSWAHWISLSWVLVDIRWSKKSNRRNGTESCIKQRVIWMARKFFTFDRIRVRLVCLAPSSVGNPPYSYSTAHIQYLHTLYTLQG